MTRSSSHVQRILGIDPGTAATGFAVIERDRGSLRALWYDCLCTSPKAPPSERLCAISAAARSVIERFAPQQAAIEELFFGADPRVALAVGQARGVCILACGEAGIDVHEYSPSSVKQGVTGYGRADKVQVQRMVQTILGMTELPRPDHCADAFAVAICHAGALRLPAVPR